MVAAVLIAAAFVAPAREMPEDLRAAYTMDGQVPVEDFYVDDTGEDGLGTHYGFDAAGFAQYVSSAEQVKAQGGYDLRRMNKANWIFEALRLHPLAEGAQGAVYGSMEPWYEAVALAHGAASVTTIEYNKLSYEHAAVTTKTVAECAAAPEACRGFDFAFSISSFDHDGLGRYGDPLAPDGDLAAMQTTLEQLAPGGVLYLTVPVGPDVVVWNLHRRYGALRLPRLLEGWEVVDRVGWDEAKLSAPADFRRSYEPVLVLRKPGETEL
eukprot:TRINITY_DN21351_c0_g1_i1.p2 TRINITY_DN21351_c0_g1~~TRINITY_DN21351_c0_g1_i1.p2  ORF type:complete len:267 (+),score=108.35 TRINITY_DN21351_c0_g1_i1:64-864(+)